MELKFFVTSKQKNTKYLKKILKITISKPPINGYQKSRKQNSNFEKT